MNWKQFLKPDWRKIVIFIFFTFIGLFMLFSGKCWWSNGSTHCFISLVGVVFNFLWIILRLLFVELNLTENLVYIGFLLSIIYWYLLSCLIVWIYYKLRKPKKK